MARSICAAGLQPALGLHHHARGNPFCLADDLIEPFRPVVDAAVRELIAQGVWELNVPAKKRLLETLTATVEFEADSGPAGVAIQRVAQSYADLVMHEVAGNDSAGRRRAARTRAQDLLLPWLAES